MTDSFLCFPWQTGTLYTADPAWPSTLYAVQDDEALVLADDGTHFIYAYEITVVFVVALATEWQLLPGMYAAIPGACRLQSRAAMVITRHGYRGMQSFGGPVEAQGRLRYIDGCSDSLLIPPVRRGDACLNHLHFPPGIDQTAHTHPSVRIGLVIGGQGECVTPSATIPLRAGLLFAIPPNGLHKFRTGVVGMDVIAYHPDSDCGPTDEDHPMLNRTLVEGVSARYLAAIRTR